jgi:phosphoribosylanthranilate isomerase
MHDMICVKICGITNLVDALAAVEAGADLLGFILYPKSPRYVRPGAVGEMVAALRLHGWMPRLVGVFVDEPADFVRATLDLTGLDLAQLHGDEEPAAFASLAGRVFKALRPVSLDAALAAAAAWAPLASADGPQVLIDAYDPHAYGGTGQRADWTLAAQVAQRFPRTLLAGGLTPENVAEAVQTVQPWGVDVASGVEAAPGRKDHDKVRAFVRAAKAAIDRGCDG